MAEDDDSGGFFTSQVSFNCAQGTTYQIAVAGYKGASGNVVLNFPGPSFLVLDANYLDVAGAGHSHATGQPNCAGRAKRST